MLSSLAILQMGTCLIHVLIETSSAFLIPVDTHETGHDWDPRLYYGIRPRSIVVIEYLGDTPSVNGHPPYRWTKFCHGALINYKKVLAPCSCVAYTTPDHKYEVNPWHHPETKGKVPDHQEYLTLVPPHFKVRLLLEEYVGYREEVNSTWAECHRKDNNYHLYDFAVIVLADSLRHSKLAWIHTGEFYVFHQTMRLIQDSLGGSATCEIYQWIPQYTIAPNSTGVKKSWRDLFSFKQRNILQRFEVKVSHWLNCRENFCPNTPWPPEVDGTHKFQRNEILCNNMQVPQKICLGWNDVRPLCQVMRGTPVFCDITPEVRGLMGFIVDATATCADDRYAAMIPMSFGIDFIGYELRIRNSPEYIQNIPEYFKDMRGMTTWW
ncbi:Hypothetical protein NTJ_00587 [Nesidiocoris tenuis]|uniref:Peptidase S1 domain-containing protein n=1 Tax=Nesidiocoris tenuis TaxID=355587 RepID=A0ABN7AA73_9HEMI|nr:Hypothetical protein NTJ_00587 [Nesidiocoris tenuis]